MYWLYNIGKYQGDAVVVHIEEEKIIVNEKEFSLHDLMQRSDFSSYCKYVFPFKQFLTEQQRTIQDENGGTHFYPYVLSPYDVLAATNTMKLTQEEYALLHNYSIQVSVLFYPHSTNFKNAMLMVAAPSDPNVPVKVTTKDEKGDIVDYRPDNIVTSWETRALPKCTLTASPVSADDPSKGKKIKFVYNDVNGDFVDVDFQAKIKCSAGYLSHHDLNVVSGKAECIWLPLGLSEKETIKVQIEIGKFTDICSVTF